MAISSRSFLLVTAGFAAGAAVSTGGFVFASSGGPSIEPSDHSYVVFIDEIWRQLVPGQEFSGEFTRKVTLSDGSMREVTLRPIRKDGHELVELTDKSVNGVQHSYMGPFATTIDGSLMINVKDAAKLKAEMTSLTAGRFNQR